MFLFTTPSPSSTAAPGSSGPAGSVVEAIQQGARQTGTDFGYLLDTARRESALDPSAKAPTSSATGLFQFVEQTWLGLVKSEGARLGLSDLASTISPRPEGGYGVADPASRQAILKLRENPTLSAVLAGTLTRQNSESLAAATGREPSAGELYVAHVLGARGAADLIRSADATPDRPAALDFPEAANANRAIFYDRGGRARNSGEVYGLLAAVRPDVAATAATAAPADDRLPRLDGPALYGLFQTDRRTGPISDAVAKLWTVGGRTVAGRNAAGATAAGPAFFPRDAGQTSDAATTAVPDSRPAAAEPPPAAGTASVPLPPPRPRNVELPGSRPMAGGVAPGRRRS